MSLALFPSSVSKIAQATYSLGTNREKIGCALGNLCKVGLVALLILNETGVVGIPSMELVQVGLGSASLGFHLLGNLHKNKLGLAKELLETLPLIVLGALGAGHVISISKMTIGSLISLATTTGVYWVVAPCVLTKAPALLQHSVGNADALASNTDALLGAPGDEYGAVNPTGEQEKV